MLHIIANCDLEIDKNCMLSKFIENTRDMKVSDRSVAFEQSSEITYCHKLTHNPSSKLTKRDMERVNYLITKTESEAYSSFYHYICFIQKDGILYEFDSRRDYPIARDKTDEKSFLKDALTMVQKYVAISFEPHLFSLCAFSKK